MRDTGRTQEHEEVAPQEVTSGRRTKWFQETLREEAKDAGELERIMRKSKVPERFCSYLAARTSITDSKPSSSEEAAD